jgi:hypothetical protein
MDGLVGTVKRLRQAQPERAWVQRDRGWAHRERGWSAAVRDLDSCGGPFCQGLYCPVGRRSSILHLLQVRVQALRPDDQGFIRGAASTIRPLSITMMRLAWRTAQPTPPRSHVIVVCICVSPAIIGIDCRHVIASNSVRAGCGDPFNSKFYKRYLRTYFFRVH